MEQQSSEATARPWAEYIARETELLLEQAGSDLLLAMVHSRAIEHPSTYKRFRDKEEAQAFYGLTKAGYWERVALRALVLLKVPIEEREQLIAEALAREEAAREAVAKRVKGGPGGPYKPVDLSKIEL